MSDRIIEITIEELDFSKRTYCCLKRSKYNTVWRICAATESELLKNVRNLGKKSLEEIIQKLASLGLYLKKDDNDKIINCDEEIKMKNTKYRFRFANGVIEKEAFNENEARILAQAEAINRGWDYKIIKENVQRLKFFIDWCKLTEEEEFELRRLLTKAQATDIYEDEK
jgi:hypothetical protein